MKDAILGAVIGILLLAGILSITPSYHRMAKEAKRACEESLPRNQECKVIAIPINDPKGTP